MNYLSFLLKLADIFDHTIKQDAKDFLISSDEWDSLATLASIALLHEAFERKFPVKELQNCGSAKEVYELGSLDNEVKAES